MTLDGAHDGRNARIIAITDFNDFRVFKIDAAEVLNKRNKVLTGLLAIADDVDAGAQLVQIRTGSARLFFPAINSSFCSSMGTTVSPALQAQDGFGKLPAVEVGNNLSLSIALYSDVLKSVMSRPLLRNIFIRFNKVLFGKLPCSTARLRSSRS